MITLSRAIPQISLPCPDNDFLHGSLSSQSKLYTRGTPAPQVTQTSLEGFYVRVMYLRGLILRAIRDGNPSPLPWNEGSAWSHLMDLCDEWRRDLPAHLQLNEGNMYTFRIQNRLAMFLCLHVLYHICHCDLLRATMPGYKFPIARALEAAPSSFLKIHQARCFEHASAMSSVFCLGLKHGPAAFDDAFCRVGAYESCKIQLAWHVMHSYPVADQQQLERNIETSCSVLQTDIGSPHRQDNAFHLLVESVKAVGLDHLAERWSSRLTTDRVGTANRPTEVCPPSMEYLHPMAPLRQAWSNTLSGSQQARGQDHAEDGNKSLTAVTQDFETSNGYPDSRFMTLLHDNNATTRYLDGGSMESPSIGIWDALAPWEHDEYRLSL